IRFKLLQLSPTDHVLLVTMHHIVSDGWSIGVFRRELAQLYQAFCEGHASPLAPLTIQYGDFAYWQRQWLAQQVLKTQLDYWKQQLAGITPLLELPTDYPRPAMQTFRGSWKRFELDASLTQKLKALSQKAGVTLFMTLLAAFDVLLCRYSGQTDIVVGSPIANRNQGEIEPLIGFFVNTLVLRSDLSGNPSFEDLLTQVRKTTLEAYTHQDLPFEKLVEELQPERRLDHHPVVQVAFALQNAPITDLALSGLKAEAIKLDTETIREFDLELHLFESEQGLSGLCAYSSDLFKTETIQRMLGHFQTLLQGVVADSSQGIGELPLLTPAEQQQILVEWNQTQTDYPRNSCVHQLFETQVQNTPDVVAVVLADQTLTYRELNQQANQLAHYLLSLGVGSQSLVGVCLERSPNLIIALLAILKAGGAYLPLDPTYPPERLALMVENAGLKVILTETGLSENLPQVADCVNLNTQEKTIAAHPKENLDLPTTATSLAYVMYTSGSTGQPKGVSVTHRNIVRLVKNTNYAQFTTNDVVLQLASVSFDAATWEIWGSLLNGSRLVLFPEPKLCLSALGQVIKQYQVTALWLTAGLFNLMVDQQLDDLQSLRLLMAGGDVLSVSHVLKCCQALPHCQFINGYGPTENTTFTCCYPVVPGESLQNIGQSIPIGRPIANTRVYILDSHQQPVPIGVPGELYAGGDGVAKGYLNRRELNAERFISSPFNEGESLYKTGDKARYLPDGNIEFLGRIDYQVKIRGFRIELGEIESLLSGYQQVQECVVICREDTPGNKRLVAYVVGDDDLDIKALKEYMKQKLPNYMVPSVVVPLTSLPLSLTGKIDRKALPVPDAAFSHSSEFVAPQTESQIRIASLFAEILSLQPESISLNDSFFELGGHSLLATQLVFRIREAFKINLSLRALFDYPSVSDLASAIDQALVTGNYQSQTWDLEAEAALDLDIQPSTATRQTVSPMERIFLTGATGFLGTYLLSELLTTTDATVYCLVRAEHIDAGKERLLSKLEATGLWSENFTSRIIPIIGDLGTSRFGLSATEYNNLCQDIDVVYHAGAYVNHLWSYPLLKDANVLGTQDVLRLASLGKLKPVHYVSTMSVLSTSQTEQPILESATANHYDLPKLGYVQTKWVAEQLVWEAKERGLPITIHRPTRISGHSQTGVSSFDDFLSRLVKGCIQLQSFPNWDGFSENLVPVDYVSRGIVCLSQQNRLFGKAFHLINPKSVHLREIFDWVRSLGYSLEEIDYTDWRSKLIEDMENPLYPYLPNFPESPSSTRNLIEYDCRNVVDGLRGSGIKLPEVNQDLFKTYLCYFRESGFLED
ncbi:MAG: amino acid adenylation domain-containing protein, partial [Moorea sp. SIO4E2]|uniref:non-ribosomal peptide synthetase family protein n=1 Tax=Moorena sp. SIO4E2 TaxID=2607826 RepID=UPI0013BD3A36